MLSVNTNVSSLNAQKNLMNSQRLMDKALERLSSGLRINRAADDAAGLAISTTLQAQINGLDQAARNANDGISLLNTAEGAIVEQTTILQRMRTLAVQAASDTNTSENRATIQNEIAQLRDELTRITDTVKFNGRNLLDGTFKDMKLQIGANAGQSINTTINDLRARSLGGAIEGASYTSNKPKGATTGDDLLINGKQIETKTDGTQATGNTWSAKAFVEAINKADAGVTAKAEVNTFTAGGAWAAGTIYAGELKINGIDIHDGTDIAVTAGTGGADTLVNAINAKSNLTGVTADVKDGKLRLQAVDGENITVQTTNVTNTTANQVAIITKLGSGGAAGVGGSTNSATGVNTVGIYRLESNSDIIIGGLDPAKAGLRGGAAVVAGGAITGQAAKGEFLVNGADIGSAMTGGGLKDYMLAINSLTSDTNVAAGGDANAIGATGAISAGTMAAMSIMVSGVSIASIAAHTDAVAMNAQEVVDYINAQLATQALGNTVTVASIFTIGSASGAAVTNYQAGDLFVAKLRDGGGWELALQSNVINNHTAVTAATAASARVSAAADATLAQWGFDTVAANSALTMAPSTRLVLTNKIGDIEITGTSPQKAGFVPSTVAQSGGTVNVAEEGTLTIDKITVSTAEDANKAIQAIDAALAQVSENRSYIGAMTNRLESTVSNLRTVSENMSAANSRILDADFAVETAMLTKAQILQQAGVAILAQANMRPQIALSLLG